MQTRSKRQVFKKPVGDGSHIVVTFDLDHSHMYTRAYFQKFDGEQNSIPINNKADLLIGGHDYYGQIMTSLHDIGVINPCDAGLLIGLERPDPYVDLLEPVTN